MRSIRRFAAVIRVRRRFHPGERPEREGPVRSVSGTAPLRISWPSSSVAAALAVRLLLQRLGVVGASEMRMALFLYAIAVSAWYLGAGPGLFAAIAIRSHL